jgi:Vitamin K-dependent gamma-carboxylase
LTTASADAPIRKNINPWSWLAEIAAIDFRALATLRIGVSLVLLVDLAYRARDLGAFYTDQGILPREGRMNLAIRYCEPWWMSLHMLSGSLAWAIVLACIAVAAAVALLLGWRTKWALAVSWLLLYSIQARFPMLLQGGDVLLRCTLVWMFFLPIDAKWSLTARNGAVREGSSATCMGGLGLLAQLGAMYFFSALLKTSPMWLQDFSATYYALNIDHFTKPLGYALTEYPKLLQALTAAAIVLEFCGPLLMFEPVGRRLWRWLVPLSFIGFHFGLFLTMDLGTFPWICMLCWITFLPRRCWDRFEAVFTRLVFRASKSEPRIAGTQWSGSVAGNAIAGFLLLYVLSLNAAKVRHPYAEVGGFPIRHLGRLSGLEQYWNMFAPGPYAYGSWVRVEGTLPSGEIINLYEPNMPLANEKPRNVSSSYPTQYWRRCFVMGYEVREKPHLQGLLRFLAKEWNQTHLESEWIVEARLVLMKTPTPDVHSGSSRVEARWGLPLVDQSHPETTSAAVREVLCEIDFPGNAIATK